MTQIEWYQCSDGTTPDCDYGPNTMVADERDGVPAFSVWLDDIYDWCWAAWNGDGLPNLAEDEGFVSQQAAMRAAQRWLDARSRPIGSSGSLSAKD